MRRPLPRLLLTFALGLAGVSTVSGDDEPAQPNFGPRLWFLERSFISAVPLINQTLHAPAYYDPGPKNDGGDDDFVFEAFLAPHLVFKNGFQVEELLHGGHGLVWTFSPMVRLRQLGGFSSPLRSPSFMPKTTFQWLQSKRLGARQDGAWRFVWAGQLTFGHHSNGGPGCLFKDDIEKPNEDPSCVAPSPVQPAEQREVKARGGSFTTDYITPQLDLSWKRMDETSFENAVVDRSHTLTIGYEANPLTAMFFGAPAPPELRRIYAPNRLRLNYEGEQALGKSKSLRLRFTLGYDHLFYEAKPSPDASPHRFTSELFVQARRGVKHLPEELGLGVRFVQGQDYYNLLFIRDIRHMEIQLVWDPLSISLP